MITIKGVIRHIKRCKKAQRRFDWMGFVEDRELSYDVKALFTFYGHGACVGYDWVNGNQKLKELIDRN